MKTVTLTRDLRPWRKGDTATVNDELADRMVRNEEARDPRPFPPVDVAPPQQPAVEVRPPLSRAREYFTRDKRPGKGGGRR